MNHNRFSRRKSAVLTLTSILAGGTTFASCDTRVRTAVIGGTKNFVYSLFDPTVLFPDLFGQSAGTEGNSNLP